LIGLPYFIFAIAFQIILLALFFLILVSSVAYGHYYDLAFLFGSIFLVGVSISAYTLLIDKEDKKQVLRAFPHYIWYYHYLTLIVSKAVYSFAKKQKIGWAKIERTGSDLFLPSLKPKKS